MKIIIAFFTFYFFCFYIISNSQSSEKWLIFNKSNSNLSTDWINAIHIDKNGIIYIGTGMFGYDGNNGGLFTYNGDEWTKVKYESDYKDTWVTAFVKDELNGGFYVSLMGGGIFKITTQSRTAILYGESDDSDVKFLYQLRNGKIIVGYKPYSRYIYTYCRGLDQISTNNVITNITDSIGLKSSIFTACFQKGDKIFLSAEDQFFGVRIFEGGLAIFENNEWKIIKENNSKFASSSILAMQMDNKGNLWLGTSAGLKKFDGVYWTTYDTANSEIPIKSIRSIDIDDSNNIWFGNNFESAGLIKFDGKNYIKYTTSNSSLPSNQIRDLKVDSNNNIWIASHNGLAVFNENGIKIKKVEKALYDIRLNNNYPNPFNMNTVISYSVLKAQRIELIIYNALGQLVKILVNKQMSAGNYQINFDGSNLSSGVYFCLLKNDNIFQVKKMLLLK